MMDTNNSVMEEIHDHCNNCVKISKCTTKPKQGRSCIIVFCDNECGFRFHSCKQSEHLLLCSNERVPCINSGYGCPMFMARKLTGRHLETCPASVVHCTMEWNRWPLNAKDRQLRGSMDQTANTGSKGNQLDVALALGDQRSLNDPWFGSPKRSGRLDDSSLSNMAIPKSPNEQSPPMDLDTPFYDEAMFISGLQRNAELRRAPKKPDHLSPALNIITNGNVHGEADLEKLINDKENISLFINNNSFDQQVAMECQMAEDVATWCDKMELAEAQDKNAYEVFFVNDTVVSEISSASMTDHARKLNVPMGNVGGSSPPLNLTFDLMMESNTRHQAKPFRMYTFRCAQEFRRDEYNWHYKNVHGDVHGGLNGWLEQRCPLAHYGCMFSIRRLHPHCKGSTVVHNDVLESFGICPDGGAQEAQPKAKYAFLNNSNGDLNGSVNTAFRNFNSRPIPFKPSTGNVIRSFSGRLNHGICLQQLPYEVLQNICRHLDSFSLCNLALTCHLFRDVCCSLLEERGIVVQQWLRIPLADNKSTWQTGFKRWFFSTSFSPVHRWGFEDEKNMANHLLTCPYFQRTRRNSPVFLPAWPNLENEKVYNSLKDNSSTEQKEQTETETMMTNGCVWAKETYSERWEQFLTNTEKRLQQ